MKEIRGKVSIGSKPIQGVRIKGYRDQFSTTSNDDGYYRLSVPKITSSLSAKHLSFHDRSVSIGNSQTVNFSLFPNQIRGTVQNVDGDRMRNALVSIRGTNASTQTDINGRFRIGVPPNIDSIILVVSLRGYKPQSKNVTNETDYSILLRDSIRNIEVKVLEKDNNDPNIKILGAEIYYKNTLIGTTNNQGIAKVQIPMRQVKLIIKRDSYASDDVIIITTQKTIIVKLNKMPH